MLEKRSFTISGHRTSVALEPEFWAALAAIAVRSGRTLSRLIVEVDLVRPPGRPLASQLRVLALERAQTDGTGSPFPDQAERSNTNG